MRASFLLFASLLLGLFVLESTGTPSSPTPIGGYPGPGGAFSVPEPSSIPCISREDCCAQARACLRHLIYNGTGVAPDGTCSYPSCPNGFCQVSGTPPTCLRQVPYANFVDSDVSYTSFDDCWDRSASPEPSLTRNRNCMAPYMTAHEMCLQYSIDICYYLSASPSEAGWCNYFQFTAFP